MFRKIKDYSGFTIIEIIYSLTIFTILFFAISCLMLTIINVSYNTKHRYEATLFAQKRYEEIKSSKEIEEGVNNYEFNGFIINEEITKVEKYNGAVYRVAIKISLDEQVLETIDGLKIIKSRVQR